MLIYVEVEHVTAFEFAVGFSGESSYIPESHPLDRIRSMRKEPMDREMKEKKLRVAN